MRATRLHFRWELPAILPNFRSAVSLHSHTSFSKELLDFIPRYSARIPGLSQAVTRQIKRYERLNGRPLRFDQAWWTPPLAPKQAWEVERGQIENGLGLKALISITDHDNIEAPQLLRVLPQSRHVPVSVEWTVPFGPTFFHMGIHNIPTARIDTIMPALEECTRTSNLARATEVMADLHATPGVLVVWNHPLWDEMGVGGALYADTVKHFRSHMGAHIHAYEINGLRSWKENSNVLKFADETGTPVVAGGDRHGFEPNAVLNLSGAGSFSEFVDEVREGHSDIVVMPQYQEDLRLRILHSLVDVLRDYPSFPEERRRWTDRVLFQNDEGTIKTLSDLWLNGSPKVVQLFISGIRLLENRQMLGALRFAFAQRPQFIFP